MRARRRRVKVLISQSSMGTYEDLLREPDERDEVDHMIEEVLSGAGAPELEE